MLHFVLEPSLKGGKVFKVEMPTEVNGIAKSECKDFQKEENSDKETVSVNLMPTKDHRDLNCLKGGCTNCGYNS